MPLDQRDLRIQNLSPVVKMLLTGAKEYHHAATQCFVHHINLKKSQNYFVRTNKHVKFQCTKQAKKKKKVRFSSKTMPENRATFQFYGEN